MQTISKNLTRVFGVMLKYKIKALNKYNIRKFLFLVSFNIPIKTLNIIEI